MAKKIKKQKIPYVYVATPAYDGKVDADYTRAVAEAAFMCGANGIRFGMSTLGNGAFIELNRNILVTKFLENKDFTHLFFIDGDLEFPWAGFINLILADLPVAAGVYRRRQEPEDYPGNWLNHPTEKGEDGEEVLWVEDDNWLQCARVPTGFLCIRRDVIERMVKDCRKVKIADQPPMPWLFETKIADDGGFIGEDFVWCDKYMAMYREGIFDKPIQCLVDMDFTHGGYKGNWAKFLLKRVEGLRQKKERAKLGKKVA